MPNEYIDWDRHFKEYVESQYKTVTQFFIKEKGWSKKKTTTGHFLRKTKGWNVKKDIYVVRNRELKRVDTANKEVRALLQIIGEGDLKNTAKVAKYQILTTLSLLSTNMLADVQTGLMSTSEVLKQMGNIEKLLMIMESVEIGDRPGLTHQDDLERLEMLAKSGGGKEEGKSLENSGGDGRSSRSSSRSVKSHPEIEFNVVE